MPVYPFRCFECGSVKDVLVPLSEAEGVQLCGCGGCMVREFATTTNFVIPAYMRAQGSNGSERQAAYLRSDRHKRDMQEAEKVQETMRQGRAAWDSLPDYLDRHVK